MEDDPSAQQVETAEISEEFPSYYSLGPGRLGFVKGISCDDNACDDLRLTYLQSAELVRHNLRCHLTEAISGDANPSTPPSAVCTDDHYVAGLICTGSRCEHLQLYCCFAEFRDLNPRDGREHREETPEPRDPGSTTTTRGQFPRPPG